MTVERLPAIFSERCSAGRCLADRRRRFSGLAGGTPLPTASINRRVMKSKPGGRDATSEAIGKRDDPEFVPASPEEVPEPSTPPEIPASAPNESPQAPPLEQPDIDLPEVTPPAER